MSINSSAINQWPIPYQLTTGDFSLWGIDLCGDGVFMVSFPDKHDNKYSLNIQENPYIDWSVLLSRLLHRKDLTIDILIKADTDGEANDKIDEIKKLFSKDETVFRIPRSTGSWTEIREIIVHQESISFTKDENRGNVFQCSIKLVATSTPRFYAKDMQSKTYQDITTSFNGDLENKGTAKSYPEYYFVFGSVSGTDEIRITTDWYTLEIDETINSNDVLVVNTDVMGDGGFVKLNGVLVDYNGRLDVPLNPWSNIVQFDINGTFTVNLSCVYRKNYE